MYIKWKNIFFWCGIIVLIFAIIQQGNMLINNVKSQAAISENESHIQEHNPNIEDEGDKDAKNEKKEVFNNHFLKTIMKKSIPMMELGYKINGDDDSSLLLSLFSMTTKINMKDPKTLLASQIPILETFEPDDVQITIEDQKAIYEDLAQKPMNNDEILPANRAQQETKLDNKDPLVLIYHTHTTESYTSTSENKIDYVSPWRSLDKSKNVARIGEEIKKILEEDYGIKVVHDTTLHDYPDYTVSYSRSLQTAEKLLKKHPSIKYVFDIHRDGLTDTAKNREVYLTVFGEKKTAKVSMVVGNDNFNAEQNKKFAQKIQSQLDKSYPGIARSIIDRDNRKYNQFISDYATLLEVGSNLNTLEEAIQAAGPIGNAIGELVLEMENQ